MFCSLRHVTHATACEIHNQRKRYTFWAQRHHVLRSYETDTYSELSVGHVSVSQCHLHGNSSRECFLSNLSEGIILLWFKSKWRYLDPHLFTFDKSNYNWIELAPLFFSWNFDEFQRNPNDAIEIQKSLNVFMYAKCSHCLSRELIGSIVKYTILLLCIECTHTENERHMHTVRVHK